MVCKNLSMAVGERSTSQKLSISFLAVSGLKYIPTGFCIHPFATSIHNADRFDPRATNHVDTRWNFLLTFSQPKNITAMNVDSRKKAIIPSIARGAPKISPTNQE